MSDAPSPHASPLTPGQTARTAHRAQPLPVPATLPELQALAAAAELRHTPCDTGPLVWHGWGEGPPVVLLHGGAGSWTHWARNVAALVAAGRRVWAADMPGFGDSALPGGCTDADHLPPWLEAGLQQLVGAQPVDVVGFSFGGLVAGYWAAASPARVRRLVLVGAPALSGERRAPLPLRLWAGIPPGPRLDAVHRHNLATLMLAHEAAIDDLAVHIHAANVGRDRMRRRRLMLTDALAQLLPQLSCEVYGFWGERDALYLGRTELVGRVLATAPGFRVLRLQPDAGHWVMYEAAAAFDHELACWLHPDTA